MMRKLSEKNLADERPGNIMKWLFYSHPPVSERIRMAEEMRRDGEKKDLQ
jgi:Zn-dependent protease with chaperone function